MERESHKEVVERLQGKSTVDACVRRCEFLQFWQKIPCLFGVRLAVAGFSRSRENEPVRGITMQGLSFVKTSYSSRAAPAPRNIFSWWLGVPM